MEKGGVPGNESNLGGAAPSKHTNLTQHPKWTSDPSVRVSLLLGDDGPASWTPITVNELFERTASEMGDALALAVKRNGVWKKWTWAEFYSQTRAVAKSFIKLGLEPFHGVGVLGFNSPEWFMAYLGAMLAGGLGVGIYTTNSSSACQYILEDCKANLVVVDNVRQLEKILECRSQLPHLKAVVQYLGMFGKPEGNCLSWPDLLVYGHDIPDSDLQDRINAQQPNNCCSIVYTSGTTGPPKGVLLSHDNVTWTARSGVDAVRQNKGTEVCVSYLPLSHVASQMMDLFGPLYIGGQTWFAQPDALKGSLANTLKEVRPTYFMGVPRVWEKIADRVQARAKMFGVIKSKLFSWARGKALKGNLNIERGGSVPFGYSVANSLLLSKARSEMGLDRCRYCFTGAAPIGRETTMFFLSVGLPLLEIYGMSECSGPATMARPWLRRTGSSGRVYDGVEMKLNNMDSDGNGELCFRGRHVFMGYRGMEKQTSETLDEERWLHSGDIGKVDMVCCGIYLTSILYSISEVCRMDLLL
jgi:long-chain-fatty-acid--CoA ligase ACSBG